MSGERVLFPKLKGQGIKFGKRQAAQEAAKTTGRGFGRAVPKTGCHGWSGGGEESQDGASQQGEFRQTLNALRGMDKLAMSADHLFSGQRDLFDGPAVMVEGADGRRLEGQWGCQEPGLVKGGVVDGKHTKGACRAGNETGQDQVLPHFSPDGATLELPNFNRIGRCGGNEFAFV